MSPNTQEFLDAVYSEDDLSPTSLRELSDKHLGTANGSKESPNFAIRRALIHGMRDDLKKINRLTTSGDILSSEYRAVLDRVTRYNEICLLAEIRVGS